MTARQWIVAAAAGLLISGWTALPAIAQEGGDGGDARMRRRGDTQRGGQGGWGRRGGRSGWGGGMSSRFEQNSPAIGDPMPVVSVHDEGGQTFVTDRFKGQFTVLVFGCLT